MEGGVWGIVIVISAFMIQVLTFGTTASIGIYNIEFLDYFHVSSSVAVSLIGSINFGVYLGS
ncbi:monocarboxylate transporter 9, partial [Biomphalaria pfeifferi]